MFLDLICFIEEWKLHEAGGQLDGSDIAEEFGDEHFLDVASKQIRAIDNGRDAFLFWTTVELEVIVKKK